MACLIIENPEALTAVLIFIGDLLETLCPTHNLGQVTVPGLLQQARTEIMSAYGVRILAAIMDGVLNRFPRDRDVVREVGAAVWLCIDALAEIGGFQVMRTVVGNIPDSMYSAKDKETVLGKMEA